MSVGKRIGLRTEGRRALLLIVIPAILLSVLLSACGQSQQASGQGEKKITIAVMGSQEVYAYDPSFFNGIKMAAQDCNEAYEAAGITISLAFYDDGYEYEKGLLLSSLLAGDEAVTAVFGSHSFEILDAGAPVFENAGKILLAVNGMMDRTIEGKRYGMIFRNTFGEKDMGASLALYAARRDIARIAICRSDTEFENNLALAFCSEAQKAGLSVVDITSELGVARDFNKKLEKWRTLEVDGVVISRDAIKDAFTLASYIKEGLQDAALFGDFSFDAGEMLVQYRDDTEGLVMPALVPVKSSPELSAFYERYRERYGEEPTWWAAHGYDSVRLIAQAAYESGTNDPEAIARFLHESGGYQGLTGKIAFDGEGLLTGREPTYSVVRDARLTGEE